MATQILQGEDKEFEFTLTDSAGTAVDLDTANGIICWIIDKGNKTVKKYSKVAKTGHTLMEISDAANGKFKIKLQSTDTVEIVPGILKAEVKIEQTDAGFDDSTLHTANNAEDPEGSVELAEIVEAKTKDESDLTP